MSHAPAISEDDAARLDNAVYSALTSTHARFAERSGRAARYDAQVAPFMGFAAPPNAGDWQDALELLPPGAFAALIADGSQAPDALRVAQSFDVCQMVGEVLGGVSDPDAVTLGVEDVPEMLELVQTTQPGPFLERTSELGRYVGIREQGVLVAMAGERMRFDGWTEVSAVCTAPSHRGRGLARRLVATLIADIEGRSERVFLHVLSTNTPAIGLYEQMGFRARGTRTMHVIARTAA